MIKRYAILLWCALFIGVWALPVAAQVLLPLRVREARQVSEGVDRLLTFTVENPHERPAAVQGRVIAISVYGASLPQSLPVESAVVPANGSANINARWHNAPAFGQLRATIILNEGLPSATIASFTFWLLPDAGIVAIVALGVLLIAAGVRFALRPRRVKKTKVPPPKRLQQLPHQAPPPPRPAPPPKPKPLGAVLEYRVEPDDSLMGLSSRFEVTWQELARLNRLKPPYALVPGQRLQIPRHQLKRKAPPQA